MFSTKLCLRLKNMNNLDRKLQLKQLQIKKTKINNKK